MHILRVESRSIDGTAEAVDLGQTPADIVALSFTDADLSVLAAAWEAHGDAGRPRWQLSIADSGPGITQTTSAPIAQALEEATREAHRTDAEAQSPSAAQSTSTSDAGESPARVPVVHGEGIGLAIVKRLCELLEATLELESRDVGTTFRVSLPRKYS